MFHGIYIKTDPTVRTAIQDVSLFSFRIFTVIWIGILSLKFFPATLVLLGIFGLTIIMIAIFYPRLERSYHWLEGHFIEIFHDNTQKSQRQRDMLRNFELWDAHLVRIRVHPNADIAGKKISETDLRQRHGLNIIIIQRGLRTIVAPSPDEYIFPKDELLFLGTDEQMDNIRLMIEKIPLFRTISKDLSDYGIKKILIDSTSSLDGVTIADSRIRERFGGIVVGVERNDKRNINPAPDYRISTGDLLWVVGEIGHLQKLEESIG